METLPHAHYKDVNHSDKESMMGISVDYANSCPDKFAALNSHLIHATLTTPQYLKNNKMQEPRKQRPFQECGVVLLVLVFRVARV